MTEMTSAWGEKAAQVFSQVENTVIAMVSPERCVSDVKTANG
jgi:hypothetical protein